MLSRLPFGSVWVTDFEYHQPDGGLPDPLCVVGRELRSRRWVRLWLPEGDPGPCPFDTGPDAVFAGHNFTAETLCHIMLGWPQPAYCLDTYAEMRACDNGKPFAKAGLIDAAMRLGIPTVDPAVKEHGRSIAIRGRTYAEQHKDELIRYCESDVDTNAQLLLALLPKILERNLGLAHALIRGSFMMALAWVEYVGVPVDAGLLTRLQAYWPDIRRLLINRVDTGVTDCYVDGVFNRRRFTELLDRLGLLGIWPRTEVTGAPSVEEEVFKDQARGHPVLEPLFQLHVTLERFKKLTLPVGPDGRHRAVGQLGSGKQKRSAGLYAFGTRTGRNAPKGSIYQSAKWVRNLIRSDPGMALVYSDYVSQEMHVTARKSRDPNMIAAIEADDAYLWFARTNGLVPSDATKITHKTFRDDVLKPFNLSLNYGSGAAGIASRIHVSEEYAKYVLLNGHKKLFPIYWQWVDDFVHHATAQEVIYTGLGWPLHITADIELRSLQNHPIQAAGADMLRLATIGLVARNIRVCALVHDAVLTECREEDLEAHKALVSGVMRQAAKLIIGHEIPVDHKITCHFNDYHDARGVDMYTQIIELLEELEAIPTDRMGGMPPPPTCRVSPTWSGIAYMDPLGYASPTTKEREEKIKIFLSCPSSPDADLARCDRRSREVSAQEMRAAREAGEQP